MSAGILRVLGVSKAYNTYTSEWDRVLGWFGLRGKPKSSSVVLEDISFDVAAGEAVGIIGQNGSGKSTLLKIITGTLSPTTGAVTRHGRIAALLELGLGFNGDFTGRENAANYLRMIGLSGAQVNGLIPMVESFAEIGDYFDQPVRTYSSGMQMRVAFAAATASRPDVLIVDEALAVGDSYFIHKCMARIREFCSLGTTLLFVSHSPDSVRQLCDRGILLDKGKLLKDGPPDEVVDYYNALIAAKENGLLTIEQRRNKEGWLYSKSGGGEASMQSIELVDAQTGAPVKLAALRQRLRIRASVCAHRYLPVLVIGYIIRDVLGHVVWGTNTWHTKQALHDVVSDSTLEVDCTFECRLGPGSYSLTYALAAAETHVAGNFEWVDNVLVFDVINSSQPLFIGSTWLDAEFTIRTQIAAEKDALVSDGLI